MMHVQLSDPVFKLLQCKEDAEFCNLFESFQANITYEELITQVNGISILWRLASCARVKDSLFLTIWERFKKVIQLKDLNVQAQTEDDKGITAIWHLTFAASVGKANAFCEIWNHFKNEMQVEHFTVQAQSKIDFGISPLMLLVAADKQQMQFSMVFDHFKSSIKLSDLRCQNSQGASILWSLALASTTIGSQDIWKVCEHFLDELTIDDILLQPSAGEHKEKSVLFLLTFAAFHPRTRFDVLKGIGTLLLNFIQAKPLTFANDALFDKIWMKFYKHIDIQHLYAKVRHLLGASSISEIMTMFAKRYDLLFLHTLHLAENGDVIDVKVLLEMAEKSQISCHSSAYLEVAELLFRKRSYTHALEAFKKTKLELNQQLALVCDLYITVLADGIDLALAEQYILLIEDADIRIAFLDALKAQSKTPASTPGVVLNHVPSDLKLHFLRYFCGYPAFLDETDENTYEVIFLSRILDNEAKLLELLEQAKNILSDESFQNLLRTVISPGKVTDNAVKYLVCFTNQGWLKSPRLISMPEDDLLGYVESNVAEINSLDGQKQNKWRNNFEFINLPASVVSFLIKSLATQKLIKLAVSKKKEIFISNSFNAATYSSLKNLIEGYDWLEPLPSYKPANAIFIKVQEQCECSLAVYYAFIEQLNIELNKLETSRIVESIADQTPHSAPSISRKSETSTAPTTHYSTVSNVYHPQYEAQQQTKQKVKKSKKPTSSSQKAPNISTVNLVAHPPSSVMLAPALPSPSPYRNIGLPAHPIEYKLRGQAVDLSSKDAQVDTLKQRIAQLRAASDEVMQLMHCLALFDLVLKINRELNINSPDLIHKSYHFLNAKIVENFIKFIEACYTYDKNDRDFQLTLLLGQALPMSQEGRIQFMQTLIPALTLAYQHNDNAAVSGAILVLGEQFSRMSTEFPNEYNALLEEKGFKTIANNYRRYRNFYHGPELKLKEVSVGTINQGKDWMDNLPDLLKSMDKDLIVLSDLIAQLSVENKLVKFTIHKL